MSFPVKALKLLLHDLQASGEHASMGYEDIGDLDSDDGVSLSTILFR